MPNGNMNGNLNGHGHLSGVLTIGAGGTSNYNELENRPSVNNIILEGNKTSHELNLASMQDVSDIASDVALLSQKLPKNYSTAEQNTGVKWIDGKYIYVRSFNYTINASETVIFQNSGIDKIIKIEGFLSYLNYYDFIPYSDSGDYVLPRLNPNNDFAITSSNFFIQNHGTGTGTIYYTKNE